MRGRSRNAGGSGLSALRNRAADPSGDVVGCHARLREVGDQIESLNGRPTTTDRCWAAIRGYQQEPTEANRLLMRDAYLAVPAHLRRMLGDMDRQDRPLKS
jgi:hypothetical protein